MRKESGSDQVGVTNAKRWRGRPSSGDVVGAVWSLVKAGAASIGRADGCADTCSDASRRREGGEAALRGSSQERL